MKKCYQCGKTKPAEQFYRNNATKDGLSSSCKECTYEKRRDEYAARRRIYHWEHREENAEYCRQYYEAHQQEVTKKQNEARIGRIKLGGPMPSKKALAEKLEYHDHKCWICGKQVFAELPRYHPSRLTWDHVKPLCAGGNNAPANIKPTCYSCNSIKGKRWFGIENLDKLIAFIAESYRLQKKAQ